MIRLSSSLIWPGFTAEEKVQFCRIQKSPLLVQ